MVTSGAEVTEINRKTDYATRVMLHLAMLSPGSWTTSAIIARERMIPRRIIGQIISPLAKAGLVTTKRGKGGGVCIARPACEITLLEVVEVMQGPLALNVCVTKPEECQLSATCPMVESWTRVGERLSDGLRQETLDKLAARAERLSMS